MNKYSEQVEIKKSQLTAGLSMFMAKFILDHGVLTAPFDNGDSIKIMPVKFGVKGAMIRPAINKMLNPTDKMQQECYAQLDALNKALCTIN